MSLCRVKRLSSKFQIALIALIPFLFATGARAGGIYDITIINATFTAEYWQYWHVHGGLSTVRCSLIL